MGQANMVVNFTSLYQKQSDGSYIYFLIAPWSGFGYSIARGEKESLAKIHQLQLLLMTAIVPLSFPISMWDYRAGILFGMAALVVIQIYTHIRKNNVLD